MQPSLDDVEVWKLCAISPDTYALLVAVFYWHSDAVRYVHHARTPWDTHVIRDRRPFAVEVHGPPARLYHLPQ